MCVWGGGGGNEPFLLLLDYAVLKRLGGGTVFGLCFIEGGGGCLNCFFCCWVVFSWGVGSKWYITSIQPII